MLAGLGKGLLLRLGAYALFVWGFWLLFQAFERSSVVFGLGGGAVVLAAMWAMTGFRRAPASGAESSGKDTDSKSGDSPAP